MLFRSGNGPGKTFLAAGIVSWFYDTHKPGICLTTAPTGIHVKDVLWRAIRVQRKDRRGGLQPRAPHMEDADDHYAIGYTAETGDAFQGRHGISTLIVFDESQGVSSTFWESAEGMMTGEDVMWLSILNPLDITSRAYDEDTSGKWHSINLNSLEHPNVIDGLHNRPARYPGAVSVRWVEEKVHEWCEPVDNEDASEANGDFKWKGSWFRPGPIFEARVLGRWPSTGGQAVWTEALWESCLKRQEVPMEPIRIGCDVALYGDDFTSIIVRRGPCALHHETHNGWSGSMTAERIKELCFRYCKTGELPQSVICRIDDIGETVIGHADDFSFININSSQRAVEPEKYPNVRSELWFVCRDTAKDKRVDLSRLSKDSQKLLRSQLLTPTWKPDARGRMVVEPKGDTKKRRGRSPDRKSVV